MKTLEYEDLLYRVWDGIEECVEGHKTHKSIRLANVSIYSMCFWLQMTNDGVKDIMIMSFGSPNMGKRIEVIKTSVPIRDGIDAIVKHAEPLLAYYYYRMYRPDDSRPLTR